MAVAQVYYGTLTMEASMYRRLQLHPLRLALSTPFLHNLKRLSYFAGRMSLTRVMLGLQKGSLTVDCRCGIISNERRDPSQLQ